MPWPNWLREKRFDLNDIRKMLRTIVDKATDDEARGTALFGLASAMNDKFQRQDEGDINVIAAMFNEVKEKYADVKYRRSHLGKQLPKTRCS